MKILEITEYSMIFEFSHEGLDLEIHVNCDEYPHEEGSGYEKFPLNCPKMVMSEINAQRIVRDYKVLGVRAFKLYEEKYVDFKEESDLGD